LKRREAMRTVVAKKTKKFKGRWRFIGDVFDVTEEDFEQIQGTVELVIEQGGEIVEVEATDYTPLPSDFPQRDLLLNAGYGSIEDLLKLDDLTSITGIGPKSAEAIYGALGGTDD
jgi:hypothetical protein